MKSQIFKTAWKMVKELGITLSSALTIAWAEFKITVMEAKYASISVFEWKKALDLKSLINVLVEKKNNLKPRAINFNRSINNDGAAAYYGKGFYNAD